MSKHYAALRRLVLEILGWTLVVLGIAALVLPGPGLLGLAAGLAILSQQYVWAERRLGTVRHHALKAAAEGVRTWPRILLSCTGAVVLMAVGIVWGIRPPAPHWWPWPDQWWLPGGWGSGISMIISALIALTLIGYSFRRFRGRRRP